MKFRVPGQNVKALKSLKLTEKDFGMSNHAFANVSKRQVMSSCPCLTLPLGSGGYPKWTYHWNGGQSHLVRQRLPFMQLRKHKKKVVLRSLSMRNMPSIQLMLRPWCRNIDELPCHNQTRRAAWRSWWRLDWLRLQIHRGRLSCRPLFPRAEIDGDIGW